MSKISKVDSGIAKSSRCGFRRRQLGRNGAPFTQTLDGGGGSEIKRMHNN